MATEAVFGGGAALAALYLHHRVSEDLDFFLSRELEPGEAAGLAKMFTIGSATVRLEVVGPRTSVVLSRGPRYVGRVDFAFYPFDPVGKRGRWRGLLVESLEDMTVNKLQAVLTRNQPRDFVDLYFLLNEGPLRDPQWAVRREPAQPAGRMADGAGFSLSLRFYLRAWLSEPQIVFTLTPFRRSLLHRNQVFRNPEPFPSVEAVKPWKRCSKSEPRWLTSPLRCFSQILDHQLRGTGTTYWLTTGVRICGDDFVGQRTSTVNAQRLRFAPPGRWPSPASEGGCGGEAATQLPGKRRSRNVVARPHRPPGRRLWTRGRAIFSPIRYAPAPMAHNEYALMLLPTVSDRGGSVIELLTDFQLIAGRGIDVRTFRGKVSDLVEPRSTESWQDRLGLHDWDRVMRVEQRLVVASMGSARPCARPGVVDNDNEWLRKVLLAVNTALLLSDLYHGRTHPEYTPFMLSGELAGVDPLRLRTVQRVRRLPIVEKPSYVWADRPHMQTEEWSQERAQWLQRWQELTPLYLYAARYAPPLFNIAVEAYLDAVHQERVEFRLPGFVRAAEGILAVPPTATKRSFKERVIGLLTRRPMPPRQKSGKEGFAQRALQICPAIPTHWYVGKDGHSKRIERLYHERSACVHGMLPFKDLYPYDAGPPANIKELAENAKKFRDAEAASGQLEYLAEMIARQAIVHVLRNPAKLVEFRSRETLMDAWTNGRMLAIAQTSDIIGTP